jgi:subtilisin family serine protease
MGGYKAGRLIGTAPHASFWLIRTENANSEQIHEEYAWAAGAEFADSVGADIINSSLGYSEFDNSTQDHSYNDMDGNSAPVTIAANIAASKGMVVVVSAGNEGDDTWHYISAPADSPYVLTVGAVDNYGEKATFSSYGPSADGRIKPDICAMGQAAVVASANGNISFADGTSFSAPIISGMVACLWQSKPNLTASEIIELIRASASIANSPNNSLGFGIPDFSSITVINSNTTNLKKVEVYPNPFSNLIRVKLPSTSNKPVEYTIYSLLGTEVIKGKQLPSNNVLEIKVSKELPKGNYIIKVNDERTVYFAKGIKN